MHAYTYIFCQASSRHQSALRLRNSYYVTPLTNLVITLLPHSTRVQFMTIDARRDQIHHTSRHKSSERLCCIGVLPHLLLWFLRTIFRLGVQRTVSLTYRHRRNNGRLTRTCHLKPFYEHMYHPPSSTHQSHWCSTHFTRRKIRF